MNSHAFTKAPTVKCCSYGASCISQLLAGKKAGAGGAGGRWVVQLKVITAASSASAACRGETKNKRWLIQMHAPPL